MQDMFVKAYMKTLENVVTSALVTDRSGGALGVEDAVRQSGKQMRAAHDNGNRLFFIGNGGSAGISSHMATDYSKNGGMRASALTDRHQQFRTLEEYPQRRESRPRMRLYRLHVQRLHPR